VGWSFQKSENKRAPQKSPGTGQKYPGGNRRKVFSCFDDDRNVLFFIRFVFQMRPVDPENSFPNRPEEESIRLSA